MKAKLLDGRAAAEKIKKNLATCLKREKAVPGLAYLMDKGDKAGHHYAAGIKKACGEAGIHSFVEIYPADISQQDFLYRLENLNVRHDVHGILIQLPLPSHLDANRIAQNIAIEKDVDGIHPFNRGLLFANDGACVPCTPKGIVHLLKEYHVPLDGRHAVILGRSLVVGRPLALLFLEDNATVTVCHRKTRDLETMSRQADILVAAIGIPGWVKKKHVRDGAVVVDVGIHSVNGKLVGDVDFAEVSEVASFITPVPGGVGPMTVAMLLDNTYQAFHRAQAQKR